MAPPIGLASLAGLSDAELLAQVARLAAQERDATVALIAHLAELDARRLYLAEGCASLFVYCTQVLHLSEHAANGRIEAARAARRYPVVLERLAEGPVTLTTVGLLAPYLTGENHRALLAQARHKSRREVEQLIAALGPRPDAARAAPRRGAPAVGGSGERGPRDLCRPRVRGNVPRPASPVEESPLPARVLPTGASAAPAAA